MAGLAVNQTVRLAPKVLVVEDEFFIRHAVAEELRAAEYDVFDAVNSIDALDVLAAHEIELLFTDISMPGPMDGNALIQAVRRDYPHIIVVAASASAPYAPVEGILRKPYDPAEAVVLVHKLLKGWK
jgi:two-component system, response regulator PdtaR